MSLPDKICEFCGESLHQGYVYFNNSNPEPGYVHENPDAAERCFAARFGDDVTK